MRNFVVKQIGEFIWEVSGDNVKPRTYPDYSNARRVYGEFDSAEAVKAFVTEHAAEYLIEA
jgi:hypothetical protein